MKWGGGVIMAGWVRDVMTPDVVSVQFDDTLVDAARAMRKYDIGDVIVLNGDQLYGIVTDRDIVVRGIAEDFQPDITEVKTVANTHITFVSPDDLIEDALRVMKDQAIRRLPVVQDGYVVGIVTLRDLVIEEEPESMVADVSMAAPNT
jgi:CBS domain-containing protein